MSSSLAPSTGHEGRGGERRNKKSKRKAIIFRRLEKRGRRGGWKLGIGGEYFSRRRRRNKMRMQFGLEEEEEESDRAVNQP